MVIVQFSSVLRVREWRKICQTDSCSCAQTCPLTFDCDSTIRLVDRLHGIEVSGKTFFLCGFYFIPKLVLTSFWSRLPWSVHRHFDRLIIRGHLGWRRSNNYCKCKALPCNNKNNEANLLLFPARQPEARSQSSAKIIGVKARFKTKERDSHKKWKWRKGARERAWLATPVKCYGGRKLCPSVVAKRRGGCCPFWPTALAE